MIPAWLQRILDERNPDGVTRRARATYCRSCGATVIRGLDAETAAASVTVDPNPIGALGEILAIAAGRSTYSLTWRGGRYEIDYRDQFTITGSPPDSLYVVAAHRCGILLPTRGAIQPKPDQITIGVECPF